MQLADTATPAEVRRALFPGLDELLGRYTGYLMGCRFLPPPPAPESGAIGRGDLRMIGEGVPAVVFAPLSRTNRS